MNLKVATVMVNHAILMMTVLTYFVINLISVQTLYLNAPIILLDIIVLTIVVVVIMNVIVIIVKFQRNKEHAKYTSPY